MKVKLDIGAEIDTLTKGELADELKKYRAEGDAIEQGRLRGIKYMRIPRLYATPASGTVRLGEAWSANGTGQPYTGQICGPNEGYVWAFRHLACNGLGTGSTPDELNLYNSGFMGGQEPVWQFNGNNYAYTFSNVQLLLFGGERIIAQSVGSITSTLQISLYGAAVEVPAEQIGKLVR